jgi:hypothetical protein
MDAPGQSRLAVGRSRARTAKTAVGVGAVAAFALAALAARAAHASHAAGGSSSRGLSTPSSLLKAFQQSGSGDLGGGGEIAPSTQAPQVGTGTS